MSKEPVRAVDGRYIGEYIPEKQRLDLKRKKSTGLYRGAGPSGGWAVEEQAVLDLMRRGLVSIRVYESEEAIVYEIGADYFIGNAKVIEHQHYGRQRVLSRDRWATRAGPRQEALGL